MAGQVCAIVGAGEGLGRSLAARFAREGFDMALLSRSEKGSAAAFLAAKDSARMKELRSFLHRTIPVQTEFILKRLEGALPKMLAEVPAGDRGLVKGRFYAVASTAGGKYALMDYVNFKGEGTKATERYKGQGWGMLQVLQEMRGTPRGNAAVIEYAAAADRVLTRRVANAPKDESRWLAGWRNRLKTYKP